MLRRRFKRYGDERPVGGSPPDFRAAVSTAGSRGPSEGPGISAKGVAAMSEVGKKRDSSFAMLPDLIMIDGGKGQLSAAVEVLQEFALDNIPIIGLAKQEEEIFRPSLSQSLRLPRDSSALQLLQRVRDEAHRFGLTFHRSLREKQSIASQLDEINGIGPKRRQALLKKFGSVEAIRGASLEELAAVGGMSKSAAQQVKASL
jgi:excinuclease ABC subunit C